MKMIIAMSENGVIGDNNSLPWGHIPEDMKWFRSKTNNAIVVMGRKTYESIGKALPNRLNVVVSTQTLNIQDATVLTIDPITAASMKEHGVDILHHAIKGIATANPDKEVVVIGGKTIYQALLPHVTTLYVTTIKERFTGDTVMDFPSLIKGFTLSSTIDMESKEDRPGMLFQTFTRI